MSIVVPPDTIAAGVTMVSERAPGPSAPARSKPSLRGWIKRREHPVADFVYRAAKRARKITMALKAYAAMTTSAARGAVRVVPE